MGYVSRGQDQTKGATERQTRGYGLLTLGLWGLPRGKADSSAALRNDKQGALRNDKQEAGLRANKRRGRWTRACGMKMQRALRNLLFVGTAAWTLEVHRQILPGRIRTLDQLDLAGAIPVLQFLFAGDRVPDVHEPLKVNQAVDVVARCE